MKNRSEAFGRLLKAGIGSIVMCDGTKAPVVEDELGRQIGVSADAIQRYKAGALPPEARTVQILAEACVRRGFMNRDWLQGFLNAARYHQADKLLDQLCPLGPARPRPPRVYENLPAPTYSQFVMREQAFGEITDGLGKRTAAVLIVGMGGNGKTSLAREVAAACLKDDAETPRFDSVVWVSDKDRPGTTNLSTVLDEIARTLDYPGFTQFEHDEKRREVEQLLRRQRVLLVVDNFETISDGALLTWLLNLPEPSKALITSREKHRALWSSWLVELRGMSEIEAWELVSERARALKMEQLIAERIQIEPLLAATGGNPKALSITLGLLKYERRTLQEMVDDLYAARGELFNDLFARAWALLDEAARRVLLVAPFFPDSASAEALSASADVQGFAFDRAIERLADLSLLDVQQEDMSKPPRYVLHPLVRAFAGAKLAEQPGFEAAARKRWAGWYIALTEQVGYCPNDLTRLRQLDLEHDTTFHVIQWALQHHHYNDLMRLGVGAMYFFYVRGLWDKWMFSNRTRLEAARALKDEKQEIHAVAYNIQMLSRQGRVVEAAAFQPELEQLTVGKELPGETFFLIHHCMGAYYLAIDDFQAAQAAWETLRVAQDRLSNYRKVSTNQWLGLCLYYQGNLETAGALFESALHESIEHNYERYILFNRLRLAAIKLDQRELQQADDQLALSYELAAHYHDREQLGYTHRLTARLHTLRGDLPAARASFAEAIDRFERLGMRRELAEARAELARLESPDAPASGAPGA